MQSLAKSYGHLPISHSYNQSGPSTFIRSFKPLETYNITLMPLIVELELISTLATKGER
jgi:hypothetical protein